MGNRPNIRIIECTAGLPELITENALALSGSFVGLARRYDTYTRGLRGKHLAIADASLGLALAANLWIALRA